MAPILQIKLPFLVEIKFFSTPFIFCTSKTTNLGEYMKKNNCLNISRTSDRLDFLRLFLFSPLYSLMLEILLFKFDLYLILEISIVNF